MDVLILAMAALFLTPFPLSMAAVTLIERLSGTARAALLALWPLPGAFLLELLPGPVPNWLMGWAMLSAVFYAWRGLGARDGREWLGYLAVSAWPLVWAAAPQPGQAVPLALALGAPLALASLVLDAVERSAGLVHPARDLRLGLNAPGLAGIMVAAVLMATAMPPSPSFFAFLSLVTGQAVVSLPTTLALLLVWLLWSGAGARLIETSVPGPRREENGAARLSELHPLAVALAALGLAGVIFGGLQL